MIPYAFIKLFNFLTVSEMMTYIALLVQTKTPCGNLRNPTEKFVTGLGCIILQQSAGMQKTGNP